MHVLLRSSAFLTTTSWSNYTSSTATTTPLTTSNPVNPTLPPNSIFISTMRPSQILRAGGGPKKPGQYLGSWGDLGSMPQKGIIHYGISQNRQNPLAGTFNSAIFNTLRRTRGQILYWAVPIIVAYETMQWAIERNEYLNSKEGRAEYGDEV